MTITPAAPPPDPHADQKERVARGRFWADVFRPVFSALAPPSRERGLTRIRNTCVALGLVTLLAPPALELGTATEPGTWALLAGFGGCALAAHIDRKTAQRARITYAAFVALAGLVFFLTDGRLWGAALAGIAFVSLGLIEWGIRNPLPPPPEEPPDPLPAQWFGFPLLLFRAGYAIATALIFWQFAVENIHVPTGSMQPTIMGKRAAASEDHIATDRVVYLLRDPKRWEIVTFEYPLWRKMPFVKRVVGLPGEHVEIKGGDIWVNGEIARKPPLVQTSLWKEVFPTKTGSRKRRKLAQSWTLSEDHGWRLDGKSGHALKVKPREGRESWAKWRQRDRGVPDVKLSLTAEFVGDAAADDTAILLSVTSRGVEVRATLRSDSMGALSLVDRDEHVGLQPIGAGVHQLELEVLDGHATVRADGNVLGDIGVPLTGGKQNTMAFGASGGEALIRDVRVVRDIYYIDGGGIGEWQIPDDGFVMLGDNTGGSEDSRKWVGTYFHFKDGREPLLAQARLPTEFGTERPNIVRKDGAWHFTDSDGVDRVIPTGEIERREDARVPFVRRHHVMGRAVLIYWPWTVQEAGFRPRILP